jgi:hypothetical protein
MNAEVEAPPPAEQGAILIPGNSGDKDHAAGANGSVPHDTDPASSFVESVRKVFAPCVGVVDAASILMGNCRFGKDAYDTGDAMRLRNGAMSKTVQKRQGETLEIPNNGGFDDDVSAISAHTLEEMERLRMIQQRHKKLQTLSPPMNGRRKPMPSTYRPRGIMRPSMEMKAARGAFTSKHLWTMENHEEETCSIGVSTSGSSSAEDEPARITSRGNKKNTKSLKPYRTAA